MNKETLIFYKKIKNRNIIPVNICEIGVYLPEVSKLLGFIEDGIQTLLIEADPETTDKIELYFAGKSNISVMNLAIADKNGEIELCRRESSTFISSLQASPAIINDGYVVNPRDTFKVKSVIFSEIDKGDFDLVSIDIEGAEWFVLRHMISRPIILSVETHGKYYTNPYISEILKWAKNNSYSILYKDASDTVFIRNDYFKYNFMDRLMLYYQNFKIKLIKSKRILKRV